MVPLPWTGVPEWHISRSSMNGALDHQQRKKSGSCQVWGKWGCVIRPISTKFSQIQPKSKSQNFENWWGLWVKVMVLSSWKHSTALHDDQCPLQSAKMGLTLECHWMSLETVAPGPLGPGGLGPPLDLVLAKKGNTPPFTNFFSPLLSPRGDPWLFFDRTPLFGEPSGATV